MNRYFARAFPAAVLITACGLATLAREPVPARFESEIAAFEKWDAKNAFPENAILFVGSSSIRLWQTAESFPNLPVINRGFGGSTIPDANRYFDRVVLKYKPRVIVFYSGDNDIAGGRSPRQVFDAFQEFAQSVRQKLPETPILFISIKPSIARLKMWPKMQEANAMVSQLADVNSQVIYVDIAKPMLNDREVPPKDLFLNDGLHLNAKGYELWTRIVADSLQQTLKHK